MIAYGNGLCKVELAYVCFHFFLVSVEDFLSIQLIVEDGKDITRKSLYFYLLWHHVPVHFFFLFVLLLCVMGVVVYTNWFIASS